MAPEDVPLAGSQQCRQFLSFCGAQGGIGVYAGHQVRRVVVVVRLLRRQFPDVDQNISGKDQPPLPLHQDQFTGQVAALALQDLEAKRTERPFAKHFQGLGLGRRYSADHPKRLRRSGAVGGQRLTNADVGSVERVPLPETALAGPLHEQGVPALPAEVHRVEQVQQSAVIYVRMGDKGGSGGRVEVRQQAAEQDQHLLPVAGVARVDEQVLPLMPEDAGVAAAGRLDEEQVEILPKVILRYTGPERIPPARGQGLAETPDVIKGFVEALPPLVQHLHDLVGVDDQLHPPFLRQRHPLGQFVGEGDIKDAVVQDLLRLVVVHHPHRAQQGGCVEKVGKLLRLLHEQSHFEQLPRRAILLGAQVRNIEIVLFDQLQHGGYTAGGIPQAELHQQHGPLIQTALKTADLPQTLCDLLQPGMGTLHLNKQGVDVNGLVVADPRDIQA